MCPVNNITTLNSFQSHTDQIHTLNTKKRATPSKETMYQPPLLEDDWEDEMFSFKTPIQSYVSKDVYREMNLGFDEVPKIIKIYEKLSKIEELFQTKH